MSYFHGNKDGGKRHEHFCSFSSPFRVHEICCLMFSSLVRGSGTWDGRLEQFEEEFDEVLLLKLFVVDF